MPTTDTSTTGESGLAGHQSTPVSTAPGGGTASSHGTEQDGSISVGSVPGLREFLVHKRAALQEREAAVAAGAFSEPVVLRAQASAEGRTGLRRIRIRDHQILSDSLPSFAGYDLGPGSPELVLGVLASCITHVFEVVAARLVIPLDEIRVEVEGSIEPRVGRPGFEHAPREPHNISYQVSVTSPATSEQIEVLHQTVEAECPLLALFTNPQTITGSLLHTASS
ncbi:OsmC family protein [Frankia gtarii]|uniref:OsmC family protein n=1 Tax=Frankia gtarii TaxID=2950102 RepID=UPI0021BE94EA|nr:OsmC family protein [Frankia gtarii]